MKVISSTFAILILVFPAMAQDVEMADTFRSDGKIYVVVAMVVVVLSGLLAYLFSIDRKVSRLEKKLDGDKSR